MRKAFNAYSDLLDNPREDIRILALRNDILSIADSIQIEDYDNIDDRLDEVLSNLPETVTLDLQRILEQVNECSWDELYVKFSELVTLVDSSFMFLNDGGIAEEMDKGTINENLTNRTKMDRESLESKQELRIDCKLPTIILCYLLKRKTNLIQRGIEVSICLRTLNKAPHYVSLNAHPAVLVSIKDPIKFREANNSNGTNDSEADSLKAIRVDFNGSKQPPVQVTRVIGSTSIYTYELPSGQLEYLVLDSLYLISELARIYSFLVREVRRHAFTSKAEENDSIERIKRIYKYECGKIIKKY